MQTAFIYAMHPEDVKYIEGLRRGNAELTHLFFYREIAGVLRRIRAELFGNRVPYDELVNELYIYLSARSWARLHDFRGERMCRLRTWAVPVAWRFFCACAARLCAEGGNEQAETGGEDDLRLQAAIDVRATLAAMPSRRYSELLRLLLIEGYRPEEVGNMTGTATDNVYNLKARAIRQFVRIYGT